MAEQVWCVFHKLPHESCPTLSAVCRSPEVAEALVESSRRDAAADGDDGGEWRIHAWVVLDAEQEREVERAGQISHVLDPMREGTIPPSDGASDNP